MSIKNLVPQPIKNTLEHYPVAVLSNILYGFPSRRIKIIGVTGTDGKTTTCNMIYQILRQAGKKVAVVSTINAIIEGKEYDTGFHVTSPNSLAVQKLIKEAKKQGVEYLVLEVTSHALDQHRFYGIKFDIGVITNITPEHLDYHKTFERYRTAKSKLISRSKFSILNYDDPNYNFLKKKTTGKIISFGKSRKADISLADLNFNLRVLGEFNRMNALAAMAVASCLGVDKKNVKEALHSFEGLKGRMEEVKNSKGVRIFIDFAHTPNGLENALKALRGLKSERSKIISIIGAEGYRDKGKRAKLGEIASRMSDKVIITAVDSRGLLREINDQILEGVKRAKGSLGVNVFIEDDRQAAINMAVNTLSKKGDIVGIFGKGHETSMNLDGKREVKWSDKEAVEKALALES